MMDPDCERWVAIADAAVLGDPVSAAEHEFEREHRAVCPRCRGEASLWSSLRPSRLQAVPSAEDVDEILRLLAKEAPPPLPAASPAKSSTRAVRVTAGAALLAAAAGLALWVAATGSEAPIRLPATAAPLGTHLFMTGHYAVDTCGDAGRGVTLCVSAGSDVAGLELASSQRYVRLTRGRAVASVSAPSEGAFALITEHGKVTAVDAKVSVEMGPHGQTAVRVHEGEVRVRATGSTTETLLAEGRGCLLGAANIQPVSEEDRARDLRLLSSGAAGVP